MHDGPTDNQGATQRGRGGRPRVEVPRASSVSAWLATHEHDRLIELARKQDRSVSSLVRQLLEPHLR